MGKKIGNVMLRAIGWTLLALTLLLLILRIPFIQTKIARYAANRLSSQLNTKVAIDKVAMNFIDNASLKGFYIEDLSMDTFIYAKNISIDVSFLKLLRKTVQIDKVSLAQSKINISEAPDGVYNFQFIIDAFSSKESSETSNSSFLVDLDKINISDLSSRAELLSGSHKIQVKEANFGISKFDLDRQSFTFEKIGIANIEAKSLVNPIDTSLTPNKSNKVDSSDPSFEFPLNELPFDISIKAFDLNGGKVFYREKGFTPKVKFDNRHIEIKDFSLRLSDFEISKDSLRGQFDRFELNLNNDVQVEEAKAGIFFGREGLELKDLHFRAPGILTEAGIKLAFNEFNDLLRMDERLEIDLDLQKTALSVEKLAYFLPNETFDSFLADTLKMRGRASGSLEKITLKNLLISLGKSQISGKGVLLNPSDFERLELEGIRIKGSANYDEYAELLRNDTLKKALSQIGNISFQASIQGSLDTFEFDNIEIYSDAIAEAKLSGIATNVDSIELLAYDLDVHHISSGFTDFSIFVDSLPEFASKFDTITFKGRAQGDLSKVNFEGGFISRLGGINMNTQIQFIEDYSDAIYRARMSLKEFKLGDLLENDSLGTLSMQAQINGSGLDLNSIKTEMDATIYNLDYNDYSYSNLRLNGTLIEKKFDGSATVNDKNFKLGIVGTVDMRDSIPTFEIDLDVANLNLKELNISEEEFLVQLGMEANFSGLEIDDADGEVSLHNIKLSHEEKQWITDSINLLLQNSTFDKSFHIKSEVVNANLEGNYTFSLLPELLLDFLDQHFPFRSYLGILPEPDSLAIENTSQAELKEKIALQAEFYDISGLAQFLEFPLNKFDAGKAEFQFTSASKSGTFNLVIPSLVYDGYYFKDVELSANNTRESLSADFTIDSISLSESIHLSQVNLGIISKDQIADLTCLIKNQKQEPSLGFTSRIKSENSRALSIKILEDFILNNQHWNLNQSQEIITTNEITRIPEIQINNGKEAFSLQGSEKKMDLSFTDFELSNIVEIVGIDSFSIGGLINGGLELGLNDETPIDGDLFINDIMFNEFDIGDLDLKTIKEGQDVTAFLSVRGKEMLMEGDLSYDLSSSYLFGKVLIEKLNLAPFDPLVSSYANDLKGSMQGYLALEGLLKDPTISGALYFQEVEAFIKDLATKYRIKEGRINVSDAFLRPTATLEDEEGRLSFLNGEITHDFFTDMTFNLDFKADEFLFLNSKQNKREYYYGDFVGKVDAKITGTSELPIITADISALEGTDFTIQLLSSEAVLSKEDYILFYDGSEITTEEAIDSISRKAYQTDSAVELNLNLSTTEAAIFHVIVDPVTGDRLDIRGNSNLVVRIPAHGDITLTGDYIVNEGKYRVSYENTIARTFKLSEDSKISFQGDPSYAKLDMTAIYETEVNTLALLERSGSSVGNTSASLRSEISVELQVEGTLSKPELKFDIVVPDASYNPIGNELSSALAQLRQNETQLLEQVGSLILFNSFTGSHSGGNINSMGTSTAISSVGNLIDNQLNKLASNTDGFEIDFNIDQYRDTNNSGNTNITEFGIGLQQKLFNDRLIISAGGNANLETGQSASNNFSSFAGDFVIQYLLSKDGKLRVRVFQKSDFNALSNDNIWKTGAGLTYKKKFGQIKPKE